MAENKQQTESATQTTTAAKPSLLEAAISATKQTERSRAEELLKTFTEQALEGTVTFDRNLTQSIENTVKALEAKISKQLALVMHHEDFQKLEGSWRGLQHLIQNSETGTQLKIRVFNCTKDELKKDLTSASEFDQSTLFKKIYTEEFGQAGGAPYGALIGDYEFSNHPDDITMLRNISQVAAGAFCPFISATSCKMFGFDSWTELNRPRDLAMTFETPAYAGWRSFRQSDDSRFVVLTMPRTLARLPYGANTCVHDLNFEEVELGEDGQPKWIDHGQYCWMNTAYVLGCRLTDAFAKYGWCTAIRGHDSGGRVENLPTHVVKDADGDLVMKCPTEVQIPDRREKEISDLGFLPLCHYKDRDYAVFFGGQTTQKPKKYEGKDGDAATANAAISARLPYMMATSRIAHYLKAIARDRIGSFMERSDCEKWLNNWIMNYVTADPNPDEIRKAEYPLAEARIQVTEVPGQPGSYNAVAYLRPWLQFEELTASLRMVAQIPKQQ
jgi:type VI secretion system protein ImpC